MSADHYQITSDTKSTTILFQPPIGNAAWGDIEQVGAELLTSVNEKQSSAWLIDLSRLEYMGSATVALLVRVWKAVQAGGGKVVVVCGDGMPREVIKLAGLDKVWTISRTPDDGYRSLGVRTPVSSSSASSAVVPVAARVPAGAFPVLGVVSFSGALLAGGTLAAVTLNLVEIDRNLAQLGMYGGSGIAVALGLISLFREAAWGRALGLVGLLAGGAVGTMGFLIKPADATGPAQAVQPQAGRGNQPVADETGAGPATQSDASDPVVGEADDASPDETEGSASGSDAAADRDEPPATEDSASPSPPEAGARADAEESDSSAESE